MSAIPVGDVSYRFSLPLITNNKVMSSQNFVHPSTYRDENGSIAPENREAWMKAMEEMSKERFVEIEKLEVLRQNVAKCFKKEGMAYARLFLLSRSQLPGQLQEGSRNIHPVHEG